MVACVIGNVFNDKVEIDNATGIANVALNSNYSAFANGSSVVERSIPIEIFRLHYISLNMTS